MVKKREGGRRKTEDRRSKKIARSTLPQGKAVKSSVLRLPSSTYSLAVIGGGNMGEAILAGLIKSKTYKPSEIVVTDVRPEQRQRLETDYRVRTTASNQEAADQSAFILLAVKPQTMEAVLKEISASVHAKKLVISIAAGIPTAFIESFLTDDVPVVRVMPNTPALIGEGMAGVAPGKYASDAHVKSVISIFQTVGIAIEVLENQIDAVTAISGSGPAYLFYLAEAMKDAGEAQGLPAAISDQLVRQTLRGAGLLLSQSKNDPSELRRRVTSPGGTTEKAINYLETHQTRQVVVDAIRAAASRATEMAKQYASMGG